MARLTHGEGIGAATLARRGLTSEQAALRAKATDSGHPVIVGIRPEGFRLNGAAGAGATLSIVVDAVEHLGNEQLAYVLLSGAMLPELVGQAKEQAKEADDGRQSATSTVRLGSAVAVEPGETITLAADTAKMYLFDPATSGRLA